MEDQKSVEIQKTRSKTMDDQRPRRVPLKAQHPNWKEKLRRNCLKRVQENRTHLLWKIRTNGKQVQNQKEMVESAFRDIFSDELKKIKQSSLDDEQKKIKQSSLDDCTVITKFDADDILWEYDGMHMASGSTEGECEELSEELMIEMEKVLHEELKAEMIRREVEVYDKTFEDIEDYLAQAVYEQMQLNDGQVSENDKFWCPICKQGELREYRHFIYCTHCSLQLNIQSDKVNLDVLRVRLAEAFMEHLDRGCRLAPKFCMETRFNLTALYIECEACSTFEIVL
ncbi:RPA-interacting protein A isoform X2 [Tasmannia lanceolata]|uniref:RPA-interacting protein A isoform X2 n=1 Tax=Tasmannia lanceolata TaxID=3420 RepID=UPI004062818F